MSKSINQQYQDHLASKPDLSACSTEDYHKWLKRDRDLYARVVGLMALKADAEGDSGDGEAASERLWEHRMLYGTSD